MSTCAAALLSCSWEPSPAHFSGNLIKEEVELSDKEIRLIKVQLGIVRGNAATVHVSIVNAFFVFILGFILAAEKCVKKTKQNKNHTHPTQTHPCCIDCIGHWREPKLLE